MSLYLYLKQLFADEGTETEKPQEEPGNASPQAGQSADEQAKPEAKYTDADIDRIINAKFAEWQKKKDKEITEAQKLAAMNATQKAEYERDQLQKQLDELKKANARSEMAKTARQRLAEEKIAVSDDLLNTLITDDADTTKANIDSFAKMFNSAVQEAVKTALKGNVPQVGEVSDNVTKASIMAIQDRATRQKMIAEHMDLFK